MSKANFYRNFDTGNWDRINVNVYWRVFLSKERNLSVRFNRATFQDWSGKNCGSLDDKTSFQINLVWVEASHSKQCRQWSLHLFPELPTCICFLSTKNLKFSDESRACWSFRGEDTLIRLLITATNCTPNFAGFETLFFWHAFAQFFIIIIVAESTLQRLFN